MIVSSASAGSTPHSTRGNQVIRHSRHFLHKHVVSCNNFNTNAVWETSALSWPYNKGGHNAGSYKEPRYIMIANLHKHTNESCKNKTKILPCFSFSRKTLCPNCVFILQLIIERVHACFSCVFHFGTTSSVLVYVTCNNKEQPLMRDLLSVWLYIFLPAAVFSSSFSSLFCCRRVTSALRMPSRSFSSSSFSLRQRLASSSARVFPYLPYWLVSVWEQRLKVRHTGVMGIRQNPLTAASLHN